MYNQGEILLIPVPFSDLSTNKHRPVLVLSNSAYNAKTDDILVAAVTSNVSRKHYEVLFNQSNLSEGRLQVESCVRVDKIYSLAQKIVIKRFGRLKPEIIGSVKSKLDVLLKEQL